MDIQRRTNALTCFKVFDRLTNTQLNTATYRKTFTLTLLFLSSAAISTSAFAAASLTNHSAAQQSHANQSSHSSHSNQPLSGNGQSDNTQADTNQQEIPPYDATARNSAVATTPNTQTSNLPKYEVGFGLGVLNRQHYPSSDQRKSTIFPFPYLIYRGRSVQVGRGGIVGELFNSKYVKLDFSVNGSLSVESEDNDARSGMDDLDYTFEIGPSLEIRAYESPNENTKLEFRFPARAMLATDFTFIDHEGWLIEPDVKISHTFGDSGWKGSATLRTQIADAGYFDYFFGVDPRFATATRPAYKPGGGYGGTTLALSVSKRWGRVGATVYSTYQRLDGVEFEDSPLFRQKDAFNIGIVTFVRLWASEEKAVGNYDE